MKLSIAMIVKNEEKYIEKTLIPLKKLQDYIESEIVVVDTGSTDRTVEIAKEYTNKVYFHKWNDNFGDMRNISIDYCTGDYVLVVDADEVLYDIEKLAELIKSDMLKKYNGIYIKIVNFTNTIEESIQNGFISPLLRLFKREKVRYEGKVHEQPNIDLPYGDIDIRFIHYGYNSSDYELMEYKFNRNLKLLFEDLEKDPENVYTNYQIATSYLMHKDNKQALDYIEVAYKNAKGMMGNYIYVIDKYCQALYKTGDYRNLKLKVTEGLKYQKDFLDFYFYLGDANYNLNSYDEAIKAFERYIEIYDKTKDNFKTPSNTLSVMTRVFHKNVLYNMGLSYYKLKFYNKALHYILQIEDENILKDKFFVVLKIIIEGKLYEKIGMLEDYIDKYSIESILQYLHRETEFSDLASLSTRELSGDLGQIVEITKYYKEEGNINKEIAENIKNIIIKNDIPYLIFVYYLLKLDINLVFWLTKSFGKERIENILQNLCVNYFDFNGILVEALEKEKIENDTYENIIIKTMINKAVLTSGSLPKEKRENIFLDYIAERYYTILKIYNKNVLKENSWVIPLEDKFIIEIKETLSYRYKDFLLYIKKLKNNINSNKTYVNYIKLLLEEDSEFKVKNEIKALVPELVANVESLIKSEKYQEAYNIIEEVLDLVKFDFDLMLLKYELLLSFNYKKEAQECFRNIILYGDSERVLELIDNL